MTKQQEINENVFDEINHIAIGNKIYIVERHFDGSRGFTEAINTIIENEVQRKIEVKTA